ncbi:uncharacterized protein LOC136089631 [Hydra vulgaris]|uniref:Uncharacterized protein LOC136089631 n=1 Tax=Hydra vulgaris TaxID=6087 RepID=A0ABM4DBK8_HYDVU
MLSNDIEINGDDLYDSGSLKDNENGSLMEPEDFIEPRTLSVPLNAINTLEELQILATYADVCSKIKDHEIFYTVHYVAAYTKGMKKTKEELIKKNDKVFFEDIDFSYSGVPFIVSSHCTLDCQQRKDRNVKLKERYRKKQNDKAVADHSFKKSKTNLQVTKKFNCPAKVHIKEVYEFPEFKLDRDSEWLRKDASKKLRVALTENRNIIMCRKYVLIISDISVHRNHPIGDAAGINQLISEDLIVKIGELVGVGVNTVPEMKRHLENFVRIDSSSSNIPLKSNKRFFPRDKTIRNHMMKARQKLRYSFIDQECLLKKVKEWEDNFKGSFIKFRPKGVSLEDNDQELHNSLLFVYPDKWQRRLLLRYVAIFVCENETTEAITEALQCLKQWNPSFEPKFFMTDYSNEEINSLESVKLRRIAHAKTAQDSKEAVKRWLFAYRQDRLLLNINTNNGIERQNQFFKYKFLERRKTSSLTTMLSVCIEEFLPHKYDSYVDENRRASSSYKKYHEKIPNYLTNRPRPLVNHYMRMIDKLYGVDLSGVTALTNRLYNVPSFQFNSRLIYQCYLSDAEHLPTCSCPAWFTSAYPCKHFFAIFLKENLSWFDLGAAYRDSPYFALDLFSEESGPSITVNSPEFTTSMGNSAKTLLKTNTELTKICHTIPRSNSQVLKDGQHSPEACKELLNDIRQLTYLCNSQNALDNLFEELLKVKTTLVESLPSEKGILLHPTIQPETWSKTIIKSPKPFNLPVRRKRKLIKRFGAKYEQSKAAAEICVKLDKKESCYSEIITDHSIDENCASFLVTNDVQFDNQLIEEVIAGESNEHRKATLSEINDHQLQSKFQQIQSLSSSFIGGDELFAIKHCQMLSDEVIHFCQQMMKIQLEIDVGLQDPIKGKINAFHVHQFVPFVQVFHDKNGCETGEIFIFDSLFHGTITLRQKGSKAEDVLARLTAVDRIPFATLANSKDSKNGWKAQGLKIPDDRHAIKTIVMNYANSIKLKVVQELQQKKLKGERFSISLDEW